MGTLRSKATTRCGANAHGATLFKFSGNEEDRHASTDCLRFIRRDPAPDWRRPQDDVLKDGGRCVLGRCVRFLSHTEGLPSQVLRHRSPPRIKSLLWTSLNAILSAGTKRQRLCPPREQESPRISEGEANVAGISEDGYRVTLGRTISL